MMYELRDVNDKFIKEIGYKLTEYQKEGVLLQIPRQNGKTTLLKEYYKYELNKKVLTNTN